MPSHLVIDGALVLHGDVGDAFGFGDYFTPKMVIEALAELKGDVTVRLNSGGGVAWDGVAIFNALKARDSKVNIVVDGVAASAASLIAMAADSLEMAEGSMMMIHDPSGLTFGTAGDHRVSADMLDKIGDSYAKIYAGRMGDDEKVARDLMLAETWYTAAEAVEAGIADKVSGNAATAAIFDYRKYANAPEYLCALASNWQRDFRAVAKAGPTAATAAKKEASMPEQDKAAADQPVAKKTEPPVSSAFDAKAIAEACTAAGYPQVAADLIIAGADAEATKKRLASCETIKERAAAAGREGLGVKAIASGWPPEMFSEFLTELAAAKAEATDISAASGGKPAKADEDQKADAILASIGKKKEA